MGAGVSKRAFIAIIEIRGIMKRKPQKAKRLFISFFPPSTSRSTSKDQGSGKTRMGYLASTIASAAFFVPGEFATGSPLSYSKGSIASQNLLVNIYF